MAKERKQFDRRWLWLGVAVLLMIVFYSARSLTRERIAVRAVQTSHLPLSSTVSTNGRVEPEQNYQLYSPVATTVKQIFVQAGDTVPAGKLLIVLDDAEPRAKVASAESGVKAAQASLESVMHNGSLQERQAAASDIARARIERDQARRDLDSMSKLAATGAASKSEVTAARQRLESTESSLHSAEESAHNRYSQADVDRAKAALADARASLAAARDVLAKTSIRAPIAGTIYSIGVTRTEFAEEGKLLIEMADLRHERVRAYFDEPEIGHLAVGQQILVNWNAKPGETWHGHIDRVPATVITYGTRTVGEVLVKIDDLRDDLLPDTNVTVTATTSSERNALTIPRDALHSENGKAYVFKVVGNSLKRTPVTPGTINLTQAAVLSGLQDGDWVATGSTNGQPLQEDLPIKVLR